MQRISQTTTTYATTALKRKHLLQGNGQYIIVQLVPDGQADSVRIPGGYLLVKTLISGFYLCDSCVILNLVLGGCFPCPSDAFGMIWNLVVSVPDCRAFILLESCLFLCHRMKIYSRAFPLLISGFYHLIFLCICYINNTVWFVHSSTCGMQFTFINSEFGIAISGSCI